jgi:hypothetical protein
MKKHTIQLKIYPNAAPNPEFVDIGVAQRIKIVYNKILLKSKEETLYLYMPVYKKFDNEIICYQIFQDIFTKLFYVQSKDNISNGSKFEFDKQTVELFVEIEPNVRGKGYNDIKEAIEKFDESFGADDLSDNRKYLLAKSNNAPEEVR